MLLPADDEEGPLFGMLFLTSAMNDDPGVGCGSIFLTKGTCNNYKNSVTTVTKTSSEARYCDKCHKLSSKNLLREVFYHNVLVCMHNFWVWFIARRYKWL
jgi:hypothetical protein